MYILVVAAYEIEINIFPDFLCSLRVKGLCPPYSYIINDVSKSWKSILQNPVPEDVLDAAMVWGATRFLKNS